ncbi:hypothetical protein PR202_gb12815 [Eleusine coracana subsp. coracana]|uniref:Carbohydrate kinase PfkB domain-containing protein n=1 Tax=Eleusine coracana subsp. coracana TaxID=191504 RepID=A0AAV5ENT7_ELECO|nr:hypothetical protein PR202_gb12815 [Eleusine coracana subsp. coracana]
MQATAPTKQTEIWSTTSGCDGPRSALPHETEGVGDAVYGGVLNLVSSTLFSVNVVHVGEELAQGFRGLVEELIESISKPNVV